jgi:hypothetical protein
MTIAIDRLIRMWRYDSYLPLKCFASKRQLMEKFNFCNCIIECKYLPTLRESKQTQDFQNLRSEKVRVSQK